MVAVSLTPQDDAASQYRAYREEVDGIELDAAFDDFRGEALTKSAEQTPLELVESQPAQAGSGASSFPLAFGTSAIMALSEQLPQESTTRQVMENVAEIPRQVLLGGPIEAFNESLQFLDELSEDLINMGLPSTFLQVTDPEGEFDVRFLSPGEKELEDIEGLFEAIQLPDMAGPPDTLTGEISRDIGQFIVSFIPAIRGVRALKGQQAVSKKGKIIETATASAIAAAVARDPHEARLLTFLNDVPWLSDLVPDYLADNNPDNETAWAGRLKNAIDEAGFGIVADGLVNSFKFYKAQRRAKRLAREEQDVFDIERIKQEAIEAGTETAPPVTQDQLAGLGDPNSIKTFERIKAAAKRGDAPKGAKPIFINMAKINSPDDIKQLIADVAKADAAAINRKRGGAKKKLSQMIEESDQEFLDIKDLIGRDPGPMTAAQAIASRKILVSSATQLVALAKRANAPLTTQADLYVFRRATAVHRAIQAEVIAARTETARALRSWAIPVGTDSQRGSQIEEVLRLTKGPFNTKQLAKMIANVGDNLTGVNKMVEQSFLSKTSDVLYQTWINAILSGPTTQMVNVLGNGLRAAYVIPKKMMDASISKTFYDGEISYLETSSELFGMVKGARNGLRMLWHGNKATDIRDLKEQFEVFEKIEGTREDIITGAAMGFGPDSARGRAIDYLGKAINIPTSLLKSMDIVFKSIGYHGKAQSLAMRQALSEGLEGDDLAARVTHLATNPPADLKAEAISVADVRTFTNPLPGKVGRATSAIRALPGVRWVIPIVRTPTNILIETFKGTPLALASTQIRADIAAGGTRGAEAWGRIGTGTMLMLSTADMAFEGTITGPGPTDPRLKKNLLRTGWKPFSVKIGDTYFPYNRLDPIGNFFAFGASYAEIANNLDDPDAEFLASTLIMSFAENLKSKTYLQGIIGAIEAFDSSNPFSTPEKWAKRFGTSFVPNFLKQVANGIDPTLKETGSASGDPLLAEGITGQLEGVISEKQLIYMQEVLNTMRSKVPWGGELPLRRDLWGREITRASGYGMAFDLLSPIYASIEKPDHIEKILIDNEIPVSHVSRTIRGVKLTGEELSEYAKIAGEALREDLQKTVQMDAFKTLTDGPEGGKSAIILNKVRRHREIARLKMIEAFPRLKNRIISNEVKKRRLLVPGSVSDPTPGTPAPPMQKGENATKSVQDQLSGN